MATLYYVVYPSAGGTPTAAQVKAAWVGTAVASGSETSPTVTTAPFTFAADATGLTPATSYKLAVVWSDGATDSNVAESAAFVTSFDIAASAIAVSGAISAAGNVGVGANLSASAAALSGAVSLAGDLAYLVPSLALSASPISISGTLSSSGDAQIGTGFDLAADAVAISGAATAGGDVQISVAVLLDVSAAPLALSGALSTAGNLAYLVPTLDLAASPIALSGSASVAGNIGAGSSFNLAVDPIVVSGAVSASGDILPAVVDVSAAAVWAHVLSNGKTAGQTLVELHALMTAGAAHVDVRYVNGVQIIGSGVSGDTWGPA